jgi:simple sugar transport system ATP-binding protein
MNNLSSPRPVSPLPLIEMKGITKRFSGVVANNSINFAIYGGEVHALLGENGAGKTTLMNILYGLYRADSGKILVRGERVVIRSPKDAIALKIAMVHQHFELVPTLTVADNVWLSLTRNDMVGDRRPTAVVLAGQPLKKAEQLLGKNIHSTILESGYRKARMKAVDVVNEVAKAERWFLMDLDSVVKRINGLAKDYGLLVNPDALVGQLSVGERQRVEIIKALYREPDTLILDEPTSVLTPQEVEGLFHFMRSMAAEGRAVVVITHKLPEVMAVSDVVTVLRHGEVVARLKTKETNPNELAERMVGREIEHAEGTLEGKPSEEVALEIRQVSALNDKGALALDNMSFSMRAGEILGMAGVAGNGQTELAEVLTGMRKVASGRVFVQGRDLTNASPREMIQHGVGHIPEDRMDSGLVLDMSIAENLVLEVRNDPRFENRYLMDNEQVHLNAKRLVEEYSISCEGVDASARTLSGGNMQKAILAKVLSRNPKVLIAVQPTSGLDVGATEFINEKLKERRRLGLGILLISGDLNEIMTLSDRIAVIFEGKIMGIMPAATAKLENIGLMMGGVAAS